MCQRWQEPWTWSSPKLLILQMSKYASKRFWSSLFRWVFPLLFKPSLLLFTIVNARPSPELASLWLLYPCLCLLMKCKGFRYPSNFLSNMAGSPCLISMLLVKVIYWYFYLTLGIVLLWQTLVNIKESSLVLSLQEQKLWKKCPTQHPCLFWLIPATRSWNCNLVHHKRLISPHQSAPHSHWPSRRTITEPNAFKG